MVAAMARYPDLAAQQAALRQAREGVRAEQGVFFPQVQGQAYVTDEKQAGSVVEPGSPGFITTIYQANVAVSYAFDLFGGERRTLEGLKAAADAQAFQLQASDLTLTANVAAAAIQSAGARDQIAATNEIVQIDRRQLALIQRQFELGSRTRADILQQQSSLALVLATLPALQQQRDLAEHQLAVLTGRFPHDAPEAAFSLADLQLPKDLPVSLPSALVQQRPDIRAQEAVLHQASAAVGVAVANMLPQITLSGTFGNESLAPGKLLAPGSQAWSLTTGLAQPLVEGGALNARRRAAVDAFDAARAHYQLVVLQAFQNVADVMTALDHDAAAFKADADALAAAKASLDFVQRQYDSGAVDFTPLLAAQQAYQQARIAYVRALTSRYADTVSLFQALGGGWWNRPDPSAQRAALPSASSRQ